MTAGAAVPTMMTSSKASSISWRGRQPKYPEHQHGPGPITDLQYYSQNLLGQLVPFGSELCPILLGFESPVILCGFTANTCKRSKCRQERGLQVKLEEKFSTLSSTNQAH